MKKLIVILAIAAVSKISAQPTVTFPYLGSPKSTTFAQGWMRTDSGFLNALKDTVLAPVRVGEQRFRTADSTLYIASSTLANNKWVKVGSGSSSTNLNIGSGYRWVIPNTNNVKTFFIGLGLLIDSTTNTNALTVKSDTTIIQRKINYVNKDLRLSNDSLRWVNHYNVLDFGADSSGVSNSAPAFQGAIDTANKYGGVVYVPRGKYWLNGASAGNSQITARKKTIIYGDGILSRLFITGNTRALSLQGADSVEIFRLNFTGNLSGSFQGGIVLFQCVGFNIHDCWFQNMGGTDGTNGGGGIIGGLIAPSNSMGGRIHDNTFIGNVCGFNADQRAEYIVFSHNTLTSNTTAIAAGAGNIDVVNNIIEGNTNGIKRYLATNNGHSNFNNNIINHSTGWALDFNDVTFQQGDVIDGNQIFYGSIRIKNCNNIRISNGTWNSLDSIVLDNSRYCQTTNLFIGENLSGSPIPVALHNGADSLSVLGQMRIDSSTASIWIDQRLPDTIRFKGPMYHLGTEAKFSGSFSKYGEGSIISASGAIANSETKILSSDIAMPANRLVAGTIIEIVLHGTCTSTAGGVGTVNVKYGTNGTTADGLLQSFTLGAAQTSGTTIPFTIRIIITIKTTGASATSDGGLDLINQGTTGISTTATEVIRGSATNINTTTASTFLTVSYQSGNASTASTFQDAVIKITYK